MSYGTSLTPKHEYNIKMEAQEEMSPKPEEEVLEDAKEAEEEIHCKEEEEVDWT